MSRVRFNLRPNKVKEPSIQMIYRLPNAGKLVIGTGLRVPEKYWNPKKMRVRETIDFIDYSELNAFLNMWDSAVIHCVNQMLLRNIRPTKELLRSAILSYLKGSDSISKDLPVTEYFTKFIDLKKKTSVTGSTIKVYQNVLNHFNKFRIAKLHNKSLDFADMDKELMLKFRNYLEETLEVNTVNKVIKKLRTVLYDAERSGLTIPLSCRDKDIQVSYVKQPKIYLNEDEIQLIEQVELPVKSRLDKVRDRFMIGIRTGLRFSDFSRLDSSHITRYSNRDVINIKAQKTGQYVTIPLHKSVKLVLDRYDGYPPYISEQKFNVYLKELCKLAGLNTKVSKEVKGEQAIYLKYQLVSSHICRRSFSTNAYKAGIHPKLIMSITGHKGIKQLMEYICIDEEEGLKMLLNHPYFNK